jgi:hypothetical protein
LAILAIGNTPNADTLAQSIWETAITRLSNTSVAVAPFIDLPITIIIEAVSVVTGRPSATFGRRDATLTTPILEAFVGLTITIIIDTVTRLVTGDNFIHAAIPVTADAEPLASPTNPNALRARETGVTTFAHTR